MTPTQAPDLAASSAITNPTPNPQLISHGSPLQTIPVVSQQSTAVQQSVLGTVIHTGLQEVNPSISPLISVSDELGVHVSQTIKEKIWSKEYIDLVKLTQNEADLEKRPKICNC